MIANLSNSWDHCSGHQWSCSSLLMNSFRRCEKMIQRIRFEMGGLEKMKHGLATFVVGGLLTLTEKDAYGGRNV